MQAFIVRPFNTQDGIDFERVEDELISPVLEECRIEGRTTGEITRAGNIRMDMFERLLVADLVIADISIHNANVYYELGIRHALRDKATILIRARGDAVPFDLRTDRYLAYPSDEPGSSIPQLREAVRQTIREGRSDSPVYLLLPKLEPPDLSILNVVPQGFAEAVLLATTANDRPMLAVLSEEIESFDWVMSGRRLVGQAQFDLTAWPDARQTWEWVCSERPLDFEANLRLGTVYQNLGEFAASSLALSRVLEQDRVSNQQRAEALSLRGSNAKQRWIAEWQELPAEDRQAGAMASPLLYDSASDYDDGFSEDQNHYYSGINALSLTTLIILLARARPETWAERFATDDEATLELQRMETHRQILAAAVQRSLEAARYRQEHGGSEEDAVWLALTEADYQLLTSDKPPFVKAEYDRARAGLSQHRLSTVSAARQLRLYVQLGVLIENARAGLLAFGADEEEVKSSPTESRIIVFSGHRVDAPGRPSPRFPNDREEQARSMIRDAIQQERALANGAPLEGISGGASGGDIIFQETCAELGIPTSLLLAMPPNAYAAKSVADGGPEWLERFWKLCDRVPFRLPGSSEDLPDWLANRTEYTVWERSNLWILHNALSRDNAHVTLIVLWDGKGGDGPGGTKDMMEIAKRRGVKVVQLDARKLLSSGSRG